MHVIRKSYKCRNKTPFIVAGWCAFFGLVLFEFLLWLCFVWDFCCCCCLSHCVAYGILVPRSGNGSHMPCSGSAGKCSGVLTIGPPGKSSVHFWLRPSPPTHISRITQGSQQSLCCIEKSDERLGAEIKKDQLLTRDLCPPRGWRD